MNSRLVIAVILLAAVVICAGGSYLYLDRESGRLIDALEAALQTEDERLPAAAAEICDRWDERAPLICVLIHHADADQLIGACAGLERTSAAGTPSAVREALAACVLCLEVLTEGEKLSFTNVL